MYKWTPLPRSERYKLDIQPFIEDIQKLSFEISEETSFVTSKLQCIYFLIRSLAFESAFQFTYLYIKRDDNS